MIMARVILVLLGISLFATGSALAEETGTALKPAEIKAEPFRDAKRVGSLKAGDRVEILNRQAGWFQVKSTKGSGWVRMLSIRRGEARKRTVDAEGILGLASGRAGTGRVVATTGIRGLSEEDLKTAKFSDKEVKKIESFAVTSRAAEKFAAQGNLAAQKIDYLPLPKKGKEKKWWWPQ